MRTSVCRARVSGTLALAAGINDAAKPTATTIMLRANERKLLRDMGSFPLRSACAPLKLEVLSNKTPSAVRNRNGRAELKAVAG